MGFYKLNTDGTIQSRSKKVDTTWLPLSGLTTKEDGSYYSYYNQDGTPDTQKISEESLKELILDGEKLVTDYIQVKVDALNDELGTKFTDIHSVANYKDSLVYPHAIKCKELWDWNELVWIKAREEQANAVATNMSQEDFIAILDTV